MAGVYFSNGNFPQNTRPLSSQLQLRIENSKETVPVYGLNDSARAYLIAQLYLAEPKTTLVVCSSTEQAELYSSHIKTFLGVLGKTDFIDRVEFFVGWERSPYSGFNPSIKQKIQRLRCLSRLTERSDLLFITDVVSLSQRMPTPDHLSSRTFNIQPGQILSQTDFVQRLIRAGYTQSAVAEDLGSFAVRGGILDVFSSSQNHPIRIEYFDEMIETIRAYDPLSQRSIPGPPQTSASIYPVSDWEWNLEQIARSKSQLKSICDEYAISKKNRDLVAEKLELQVRDPSFDYLLPIFSSNTQSFLQTLLGLEHGKTKIYSIDRAALISTSKDAEAERMISFEKARSQQLICCAPQLLYESSEKMEDLLSSSTGADFSSVHISGGADQIEPFQTPFEENGTYGTVDQFYDSVRSWWNEKRTVAVFASSLTQLERIAFLLGQHQMASQIGQTLVVDKTDVVQLLQGELKRGFQLKEENLVFLNESELFGRKVIQEKSRASVDQPTVSAGTFVAALEDLELGDFIVHYLHGIGKYLGLVKLDIDQVSQDFLLIEYAGNDKLYLPIYRLDNVQRYVGQTTGIVLDKLGSQKFEKEKQKVKTAVQELANQLLILYAKRSSQPGYSFSEIDSAYREFEAKFPYSETPDQLKAIDDVNRDMGKPSTMDRLICGDVGYGKTEVAMRAAYRALLDGKQVAVLVPTTVLALQHDRSFRERFKDSIVPIRIETLSRFRKSSEIKETVSKLKDGSVQLVIGTHRLLSKDVEFRDLGLVIIDEEQRFGVEHKERLKTLRLQTDVLTLSATPIPRTLHLSLMGLRDISVINTAPMDRMSIRTYVVRYEEETIRSAIEQELARGGQVFFIYNRVQSIEEMAAKIRELVPHSKVMVAHGQLPESELEKRMLAFYNQEANVLICSTIIESGLDLPTANTLIVYRADTFGLSQLYQLRGRVGRAQVRAYCYLCLPEEGEVTGDAQKRLEIIQRFVDLGSGFKIASHDLEMRGGGDILGKSQSGHIAAVGYEMYMELLAETIHELQGLPEEDHFEPEIKVPATALIPDSYIDDVHLRLAFYKRLSQSRNIDELIAIESEMRDRFGQIPQEVLNLIGLIQVKQILKSVHIKSLIVGNEKFSLEGGADSRISPTKVLDMVRREPKRISITPDSKIVVRLPFQGMRELNEGLRSFIAQVAEQ